MSPSTPEGQCDKTTQSCELGLSDCVGVKHNFNVRSVPPALTRSVDMKGDVDTRGLILISVQPQGGIQPARGVTSYKVPSYETSYTSDLKWFSISI